MDSWRRSCNISTARITQTSIKGSKNSMQLRCDKKQNAHRRCLSSKSFHVNLGQISRFVVQEKQQSGFIFFCLLFLFWISDLLSFLFLWVAVGLFFFATELHESSVFFLTFLLTTTCFTGSSTGCTLSARLRRGEITGELGITGGCCCNESEFT